MKRLVASLALVLASAGVLSAGCPRIRASSHAKPVQIVQAVPVVYAQQYVQAYGGSYGQPQQQQNDDLLRRLVEFLERQEALGAFNNGGAGGHTGLSIMNTACAACHTEGKNPKKGFVLFTMDGKPAELSIRDQDLVELRVKTSDPKIRMPPERNLPDALQNVLMQSIKGGR